MIILRNRHQIRRGQIIGICGLSGSGKSTLVKSICGLHDLWEGNIAFENEKLDILAHRSKSQKRRIQLVMQNSFSSLNPSMKLKTMFQEIFQGLFYNLKTRLVSSPWGGVSSDKGLTKRYKVLNENIEGYILF